jgi:hypothetical protein
MEQWKILHPVATFTIQLAANEAREAALTMIAEMIYLDKNTKNRRSHSSHLSPQEPWNRLTNLFMKRR